MFQSCKLAILSSLQFLPGSPQSGYWAHVEASDDAHEGIKVANVDALSGYFHPKLDGFDALLLFLFLTN